MELTKVLALRSSTRAFTPEQISKSQLTALLTAANSAPACMGQYDHLHLTVVQNPAVLDELNALFGAAVGDPDAKPTYGAPTVIYVSNSLEDEEIVAGANASCVMENMLLAAADLGLGSVYLFGISQVLRNSSRASELLGLPEGFRTVAAIAVGHPAQPLEARTVSLDHIQTNYV